MDEDDWIVETVVKRDGEWQKYVSHMHLMHSKSVENPVLNELSLNSIKAEAHQKQFEKMQIEKKRRREQEIEQQILLVLANLNNQ